MTTPVAATILRLAPAVLALSADSAAQRTVVELADLERIATADTMLMVPMRDGVRLATDLFRPKDAEGKLPLVFIKTPYDFNEVRGASLRWAFEAVSARIRGGDPERAWTLLLRGRVGAARQPAHRRLRRTLLVRRAGMVERRGGHGRVLVVGRVADGPRLAEPPRAQGDGPDGRRRRDRARRRVSRAGQLVQEGGVHQTLFTIWLYSVQQQVCGRSFRPTWHLAARTFSACGRLYDLAARDAGGGLGGSTCGPCRRSKWLEIGGRQRRSHGRVDVHARSNPGTRPGYEGGLYHDDDALRRARRYWFNSWFDISQGPEPRPCSTTSRAHASDPSRAGRPVHDDRTRSCTARFYRIASSTEDLPRRRPQRGQCLRSRLLAELIFRFLDHYVKGRRRTASATTTPRMPLLHDGSRTAGRLGRHLAARGRRVDDARCTWPANADRRTASLATARCRPSRPPPARRPTRSSTTR